MSTNCTEASVAPSEARMDDHNLQCGYCALVGRPNVGKSTLLNHLLRQKISITARKPQTTRMRILGIDTHDHQQVIFIDTPGLHQRRINAFNRQLNREALIGLEEADVIVWLVDRAQFTHEDDKIQQQLRKQSAPVILAINKVDCLKDKDTLLPLISQRVTTAQQAGFSFAAVVPIAALINYQLEILRREVVQLLPHGPWLFTADAITDQSLQQRTAEIIREKIVRQLGDELPYATTVMIEKWREDQIRQRFHIDATITCWRNGQKAMLIGKQGQRLRAIGCAARVDLENWLQSSVMLRLRIKVKN